MTALAAFVAFATAVLAPSRDTSVARDAIVRVASEEAPLFEDDGERLKTGAWLVAIAYRESSLRNDAVGDNGRARCLFQLWAAPTEVLTDAELCTRIAMARLRESARACGKKNLLGVFAAGPHGCTSEAAKRISNDRLWLARRLLGGAG